MTRWPFLKTKKIKHILINVEVVHVLKLLMPLIYLILAMRHIVNTNHVIYNNFKTIMMGMPI